MAQKQILQNQSVTTLKMTKALKPILVQWDKNLQQSGLTTYN